VSEIRTRYTVIKGLDGVDSIVPNEMLVNSVVESETFTDSSTRVAVRIGVSYDCDIEQAMQLLIDVATAQDRVMSQPPPRAFLVAFGDSAITLEVGFWIPDPQNGTQLLTSAINLGIYHAYKQAGIGIPVPQREISIKTSIAELPAGFASPPPAPQSASPARPYDA
jgi:small-conductance mechanosensitive channel